MTTAQPDTLEHAPTQEIPTKSWLGVAVLILTAVIWSLNGPLIKLSLAEGVSGIAIAFYRSLIGGVTFIPLAWRGRRTLGEVPLRWKLGSVLMFALMTATFVIATTQTAAANAIILQYTAPIWVFLLSPFLLHERPHPVEGLTLLVSMVGVGVIFFGSPSSDTVGLVVALVSGLGYGALIVMLRGLRRVNPTVVVCMNCFGSALLMAPAVALTSTFRVSWAGFGYLLVLGAVQFGLGYLLFSWALQRVEAHRASLITLLETLLNPLLTYFIVHESVPQATWVGGPIILAGVAGWMLLSWRREQMLRRYPPASTP
jgi:drug/metabolite transporter (DMT)-like permease